MSILKNKLIKFYLIIIILLVFFSKAYAESLDIIVIGLNGIMRDNVLSGLSIYNQRNAPLLTNDLINKFYNQAPNEIKNSLEPFGYYNPQIKSRFVIRKNNWKIRFDIFLSEPVKINEFNLKIVGQGANDFPFKEWINNFPLKKGDILNHQSYENAKKSLLRIAEEMGYFNGKFICRQIKVDTKNNTASLCLQFDTCQRFFFGDIIFKQNDFNDNLLSRFVTFKKGEFYFSDKLIELQKELSDSDYFQKVDVIPRMDLVDKFEVPIDIKLESKKTTKYTFGLGYGTDTGSRAGIGIEKRKLNRRGHRAGIDLELSEIGSKLSAHYEIPLKKPKTDKLYFICKQIRENTLTINRETLSTSFSISKFIKDWNNTFSISVENENFSVGTESGKSNLFIPKFAISKVAADNLLNPKSAWTINFDIQGTSDNFLSDTSFVQLRLLSKYIKTFKESHRIIARTEIGNTFSSDFSELPVSFRYFAGGDYSVRGYGFQSLSPKDNKDKNIGGKNLFVGSIEYNHVVIEPISMALFYDIGNAFQDWNDISLYKGAGTGFRCELPFGSIQLDFAVALDDPNLPLRVHFRVGALL